MYTINGELCHHGILGQKWGKMQGPPYPLGSGEHSAREKKFGYKKSLGSGSNEELYEKNRKKVNKIENKNTKKTTVKKSDVKKEGSKKDPTTKDDSKEYKYKERVIDKFFMSEGGRERVERMVNKNENMTINEARKRIYIEDGIAAAVIILAAVGTMKLRGFI